MLLYRLVELQYPALVEQRWYFGETGLYTAREIGIAPRFAIVENSKPKACC